MRTFLLMSALALFLPGCKTNDLVNGVGLASSDRVEAVEEDIEAIREERVEIDTDFFNALEAAPDDAEALPVVKAAAASRLDTAKTFQREAKQRSPVTDVGFAGLGALLFALAQWAVAKFRRPTPPASTPPAA